MSGVTPTDCFGVDVGKADVLNIALLNQIADRADGILDRYRWILAHLIQLDVVRPQSLQGISQLWKRRDPGKSGTLPPKLFC